MRRLIIRKTDYVTQNNIPLAEIFATPISLLVEQSRINDVRHVWGIFRTLEDTLDQKNLIETKVLSWTAYLPESQPQLYSPIASAMLAVGQTTLDTVVEGQDELVSWFADATEVPE